MPWRYVLRSTGIFLSEIEQLKAIMKWPHVPSLLQSCSKSEAVFLTPFLAHLHCHFYILFFCFVLFCFVLFCFVKLPTDTGQPNHTLLGNGWPMCWGNWVGLTLGCHPRRFPEAQNLIKSALSTGFYGYWWV